MPLERKTQEMPLRILMALLLMCSVAAAAALPHQPVLHVLFVDQSDSPRAPDIERWVAAAKVSIFDPLSFGDAVLIYGVHDHTADSAPLFDKPVPPMPPNASMDIVIGLRKALREAREGGAAAVAAALRAPTRSRSTRLIESLGRVPRDGQRQVRVTYLSDMLECTRELNLEKTAITDTNLQQLAQAAVDRYHLHRGALDGVHVRVVLDSPLVGSRRTVPNDHESLGRFWRLLFTSLGGTLDSFDSRVQ